MVADRELIGDVYCQQGQSQDQSHDQERTRAKDEKAGWGYNKAVRGEKGEEEEEAEEEEGGGDRA